MLEDETNFLNLRWSRGTESAVAGVFLLLLLELLLLHHHGIAVLVDLVLQCGLVRDGGRAVSHSRCPGCALTASLVDNRARLNTKNQLLTAFLLSICAQDSAVNEI